MRVLLEPVLIVGFKKIDASVFEGKERHGAVNLIVIFQGGDLVVFRQAAFEPEVQFVIGLIAYAEHVHTVTAQLVAELPVINGEVGGNEYNVFHHGFLFPSQYGYYKSWGTK